jgi:PAS domain S-box-containing protein
MRQADLKRIQGRLATARADVEGKASAQELEIALEEIQALWDELGNQADHLARQRERHTLFFERAPFACLITDVHGTLRDANLAALALLEVPAAYLHGKPLAIFIADEERDAFRMHLAMAARSPGPIEGWQSRVKSADGTPREVTIDLRPMPRDAENFLPLFWFLRDTG